jgi:hypothetical protein
VQAHPPPNSGFGTCAGLHGRSSVDSPEKINDMGSTSKVLATQPKTKARSGPKLREASLGDYDQITSLESRHGLPTKSYEEWTHLHLSNPLQPEHQAAWPIGWVIEDENERIVGSVGNIPLLYEFEGKRILAASGRGLVAEPTYRSISLLLLDCLINQPGVELFLGNSITAASAASFSALRCLRVPVGLWDQSTFWITHYQGFLESLLAMKHYPLARPLGYLLSAAAFLKDRLTRKALSQGDVEVRACPAFDDRFDDFWEAVKTNHPHLLLAVRTREVLEWHFKHALLNNRLWIVTVLAGLRLAAYAIFDRRDNLELGLKRVRLVDFQSLDGSTDLLSPLLAWALRKCRDEGIHMLENVGRWLERGELIETVAPYKRRLSAWTFIYRANSPGLTESLRNRSAWAPSLFDGYASL